jgi:spermidine/putrescine transport system ATP-binding protein
MQTSGVNAGFGVRVESLCKHYRAANADEAAPGIENISFEVMDGEGFSILGPSGCGKTTTLRCLAGLEKPDSGRIFQEGKEITDAKPQDRDIRTVFQKYALFPHLNVLENILFGLRMKGTLTRADQLKKADEMMELVSISHLKSRPISMLSGGEQQRVALARALVTEPDVLLLDEPLSALDLKLREKMQRELISIRKKLNLSIIIVTHDQEEAMMVAERIAVMNKGRILQIGTPEEIYSRPVNRFVASFIGQANFIRPTSLSLVKGAIPISATAQRLVMVRPENVDFAVDIPSDRTGIAAVLQNSIFLGDSWIHTVLDQAGQEWVIKRQPMSNHDAKWHEPGAQIKLFWKPEAMWTVDSDS